MASRFIDHLLSGVIGDRPAATAVAVGTLYASTDEGMIYQSDGADWTDWMEAMPPGTPGSIWHHGAAVPGAGAVPTWVAATARTTGSPVSVPLPAGYAIGDLLIILSVNYYGGGSGATIAAPSGWTALGSGSGTWGSSGYHRHYAFWKYATSLSEPNVSLVTSPTPSSTQARMVALRGPHTSTPIDVTGTYGSVVTTTNVPTPALTTTVSNALLCYDAISLANVPFTTPPAGATARYTDPDNFLAATAFATETKAAAGTEAADNYVRGSASDQARVFGFAVAPPAGVAVGADGDYYFHTATGDVYFNTAGTWAKISP